MTRLAMESHPSRETLPSLPPVGTFTRGIVNAILTSNAPAFRPAPVAGRARVSNAPAFRPAPVAGRARVSNAPAFRPAPVAGRARVSNAPAFRPAPVAGRARSSGPKLTSGSLRAERL